MKKLVLIFLFIFSFKLFPQQNPVGEVFWDQGVPLMPDDPYITQVLGTVNLQQVNENKNLSEETKAMLREVGMAFWDKGYYDEADWYLSRSKGFHFYFQWHKIEKIKIYEEEKKKEELSETDTKSMQSDLNFVANLPKSLEKVSKQDLKKIANEIDDKIKELLAQKDSLLKAKAKKEVIDAKDETIKTLGKEKEIIDLTITNSDLKIETEELEIEKAEYKKYLIWCIIGLGLLSLGVIALLQRKTIKIQDIEIDNQLKDIGKKNTYLEHAARIIRHDMHSGINTYIPRGISSLEKRLTDDDIKNLKIEAPLKMIKEGLGHTQKVYKSVYEFTNLVKQNVVLDKKEVDLKDTIIEYLKSTSYGNQVIVEELERAQINEILFCNAIDNLVKNGLKYNDNKDKFVKIYMEGKDLIVQDNGKGLTQKEFEKICSYYSNKKDRNLDGEAKGLGLNIALTIFKEHGFDLTCEKNEIGTKMKIKIKND